MGTRCDATVGVFVRVGRAESVLDADAAERAALARLQACVCLRSPRPPHHQLAVDDWEEEGHPRHLI